MIDGKRLRGVSDNEHISHIVELFAAMHCDCSGKTEIAIRYYLSSRIGSAEYFAKNIRWHWGIENHLHYVIDVVFEEDASLANAGKFEAELMWRKAFHSFNNSLEICIERGPK